MIKKLKRSEALSRTIDPTYEKHIEVGFKTTKVINEVGEVEEINEEIVIDYQKDLGKHLTTETKIEFLETTGKINEVKEINYQIKSPVDEVRVLKTMGYIVNKNINSDEKTE